MRQIVLDTETTGLEPEQGHRIIEVGCVELVDRRLTGNNFHQYIQPDREIDAGAIEVHGITNEFLRDQPRFEDIAKELTDYLSGAELVIHNAPFDVGFLNHEFARLEGKPVIRIADICDVVDTLVMARRMHPGQRNSLDALCSRYDIDNAKREKHGALLDAEILADVYLAMTGGQVSLSLDASDTELGERRESGIRRLGRRPALPVVRATDDEKVAHEACLDRLDAACGGRCAWRTVSG